jgi:hypothetical protein
LLFNFALDYAIRRVHVNQNGLKLNDTLQLLVRDKEVTVLVGRVHNIKEKAEALAVVSKENGLEEKSDNSKYTVMFRVQNAGEIHSLKIDYSSFEIVEKFEYLGTILNQNSTKV